jgi:hypothetical protein
MKYAVEMGSGAMKFIPNFIEWFRYSKVNAGIHRQHGDFISLIF